MISVVLASCNGAKYIRAQLDSIRAELGAADEVIVCDDASDDGTLGVVAELGDTRIRTFSNPRRLGYVANFERCMSEVRGSHVFFSDQDDVWLPGKVAELMQLLERAECAASDAVIVDENLQRLQPSFFEWRGMRQFRARDLFLRPAIIGATMACRADFLVSLRPLPPDVPHDIWISFNAALRDALAVSPKQLILYRRHSNAVSPTTSATTRPLGAKLMDRLRLLQRVALHRCT